MVRHRVPEQVGAPHRATPEETQGLALWSQGAVAVLDLLRREQAAQASDQSSDRLEVQGIGTTEGLQDIGPGELRLGVSGIVGKLDVGGGRAVLVLAGDRSHIHAYP